MRDLPLQLYYVTLLSRCLKADDMQHLVLNDMLP